VRLAIAVALVLLAPTARAQVSDGQREFEAGTQLESRGDYAGAAAALEKLGLARPDDAYADDALFEAAVIAEEHLSDPARAQKLYDQVATKYPTSRLARRARTRADFLASSLRTGEAPLREYQDILNGFSKRPPSESIDRMEKLLASRPDFALADRATYWLGTTYVNQRRDDLATAKLLETERRFPSSEWAARAKKARGDILLRTGHPLEAQKVYEELGRSGDLLARAASHEGVDAVKTSIQRAIILWLAIAYVIGFLFLHALALRRLHAWRVPVELWFYLPVAAIFVAAAATENGAIGWATFDIAVGGGLIVAAVTAVLGALLQRGPIPLFARVARLTAAAAAVACVMYIAVQTTGLTDLVIETMKAGPER
jgi:tetratricopeptide (TPR) repeat protein